MADHQQQEETFCSKLKKYYEAEKEKATQFQETCKRLEALFPSLPQKDGWWFDLLIQYQGYWVPKISCLLAIMLMEDGHFTPKPEDIILATSPKCGTTWLRALIFAIINRNTYDVSSKSHPLLKNNPQDLVPFLEYYIRKKQEEAISPLPSRKFLSSHLPYALFPDPIKTSGCRFVYICRDPKDAFVSKWHFMNKMRPKELPSLSLEDAFELFCEGASHYGPFWDHALSYWKASQEDPEHVLFLIYEDVKREPVFQVKRLAKFLGMPFTLKEENEGVPEEIVKLCSFQNLSNLDVNKSMETKHLVKNPYFFRKGEVGDWKSLLTPEMAARLDQITKEKLHPSGLTFLWSHYDEN